MRTRQRMTLLADWLEEQYGIATEIILTKDADFYAANFIIKAFFSFFFFFTVKEHLQRHCQCNQ